MNSNSLCFICGDKNSNHYSFSDKFEYIKCVSCGLIYLNKMPTENEIYNAYNGGKFKSIRRKLTAPFRKLEQLSGYEERVLDFKTKLEIVLPYLSNYEHKKLLDIGCNKCFLLEAGVQLNFEPYGVELIPELTYQFRQKYKQYSKNIYNTDFSKLIQKDLARKFDLITAFDLVEHLRNPRTDFEHIYNLLKPNGIFLFQTPNTTSNEAEKLKGKWGALKATEHYHLFNDENIVTFGQQIGFKEITNITDKSITNGDMIIIMKK